MIGNVQKKNFKNMKRLTAILRLYPKCVTTKQMILVKSYLTNIKKIKRKIVDAYYKLFYV